MIKLSDLKCDILSGFSVFLLALPLCLGISMASNFPVLAGVLTAIVGGLISTFFGSSRLTIKGPAAGLIVIALSAVTELGAGDLSVGYKKALAVGVVAACIQIIIALSKSAIISELMPPSVIHGMLAAIGVIIVAKQSHSLMGVKPHAAEPLHLLLEIPNSLINANPLIFAIGIVALLITVFWPKLKNLSFIPASIMVLSVTIPLSFLLKISSAQSYELFGNTYLLNSDYLIHFPSHIFNAITFPDFSTVFSPLSIKFILMFAIVGSIESLLTVCAVDAIDPEKHKSDLNKDLLATGVGNLVCSFIGGLPMISEIVRSKANIDYGAKSKFSNFFHGLFLLIAILALPGIIQLIPLSALAALLIFTGIRLASPKEFVHVYKIGLDQFIIFVSVFIITLAEDLLLGVAFGIILKIVLHLFRGVPIKEFFRSDLVIQTKPNNQIQIDVNGSLVFCNFLTLKKTILHYLDTGKQVIISFKNTHFVDHMILDKLNQIDCTIIDLESMKSGSKHPLSSRRKII